MKQLAILVIILNMFLIGSVDAQVPSYVPTNGLVGWWPFNGNANDESVNTNNGVVTGATLIADRFGNSNAAYNFNGLSNIITIPNSTSLVFTGSAQTISFWVRLTTYQTNSKSNNVIYKANYPNANPYGFRVWFQGDNSHYFSYYIANGSYSTSRSVGRDYTLDVPINNWVNIVLTNDNTTLKYYVNGALISQTLNNSTTIGASGNPLYFGGPNQPNSSTDGFFAGDLDDIGIWNHALTQQEITTLYQGCNNFQTNLNTTSLSVNTNSNAQFIANTNVANSSYQWQTNPSNIGWQNISNNTTYSGATTSTLNINNTQLSNHLQPFRVVANAGNCKDTSDIAVLKMNDTCIETKYISVTDTLIINTIITAISPPNNKNTIKIYPNPTTSFIYINNGNFSLMNGYSIKINNSLGQTVFNQLISQQQFYINTATWSGAGTYFVYIIDNNSNIIETRKIILQ